MNDAEFEAHARVEGGHWWFTARRHILLAMVDAVADGKGAAIADIGCGTGGNASALASAGYSVLGLDPSPHAIALATRHAPGVRFLQAEGFDAAREHLAGGGIALLTDVLEHVDDDRALLADAISAVPSGGHLVLTVPADPALWSSHDVAFGHRRRYAAPEFAALWSDSPVDVRLLSHFNARLRPVIAAARHFERSSPKRAGGDLRFPAGPLNRLLHRTFAGESVRLVAALDSGAPAYSNGVSMIAVLRHR
ncbi:MAG: class I SAM-dependent methyltransferase [Gemmatimonadales bacterium]